jgi:two-component system, chemotaxis family, chemotaxis protein CheY
MGCKKWAWPLVWIAAKRTDIFQIEHGSVQGATTMKILIVEDELTCRRVLEQFLSPYGKCVVAVDGLEAIEAFQEAIDEKRPYDLVCLDIMLPKMDGHQVLRRIRQLEEKKRIEDENRVKVIMTTGLADRKNVTMAAFGKCEAYLVKPIIKEALSEKLQLLGFSPK